MATFLRGFKPIKLPANELLHESHSVGASTEAVHTVVDFYPRVSFSAVRETRTGETCRVSPWLFNTTLAHLQPLLVKFGSNFLFLHLPPACSSEFTPFNLVIPLPLFHGRATLSVHANG